MARLAADHSKWLRNTKWLQLRLCGNVAAYQKVNGSYGCLMLGPSSVVMSLAGSYVSEK